MDKNKIKARLIEREGSIEAVAKRIRKPRSQVSATINYLRLNLAIRQELIRVYNVRFSPYYGPSTSARRKPRRTTLQEAADQ